MIMEATMEKVNLKEFISRAGDKPAVTTLYVNDCIRVKAIALKKGTELPEHKTAVRTFLTVITGKIRFILSDETIELEEGDWFNIPIQRRHSVEALTDAVFTLTQNLKDHG